MTEHTTEHLAPRRSRPVNRSRGRGTSHQGTNVGRYALYALAACVVVLVIAVAVDVFSSMGRVHPGVTVGGVDIGGKSPTDAVATLKSGLPAKAAAPLTVAEGSATWTVKGTEIDASFDYAELLDAAMAVGRSGSFVDAVAGRARSWFGGTRLPGPATADPDKLKATIDRIASAIDVAPRDAVLKVNADGVTLKSSATGIAVDRPKLERDLLGAFTADNRRVAVRAVTAQPKIDDASAKAAEAVVEKMISGPATITYRAKSWTLTAAELAKMISFQQVETSASAQSRWVLDPVISTKDASKTIVPKIGASLGNPPKNARFVTSGGSVHIVASMEGVGPDIEDFAATLGTVLKNPARGRTVELRTRITAPALTTDQARSMGINKRISTFTTTYSSGMASRVNNIHVLGAALDGKLVAPGASFSLNGAVGQRTAAKGYQEANAIVKGKLVPQLGGGICQVATTLFNAIFFSGFPVTERINHSFYISHYPPGRDATVSWGGPDLRWKNTSPNWVLVSVSYSSDSITVSLYGTDPGYHISYTTVPFTDNVPYKTVKVNDPTMAVGTQTVVSPGENGGKVIVTRTVKKGPTVVRTDTFTSNYTPVDETINVGTKAVVKKPVTTKPVTTKPVIKKP